MRNVKPEDLVPGDIIAQHILNEDTNILLACGSILTAKSIESLKNWKISLVRVREESDSDEDINLALQFDEVIRPFQNLPEIQNAAAVTNEPLPMTETSISATPETSSESLPPSIISEKAMQQYDAIFNKLYAILRDRQLYNNIATLQSMAHIIHRFTATTPGVIGYTLRQIDLKSSLQVLAQHSLAVAIIANKIALLLGYEDENIKLITLGAMLHDIGKLTLPPNLPVAAEKRSNDEEMLYRFHVQNGYDLYMRKKLPQEIYAILLQHHEYIDGSGFPQQLKGISIHPFAQIVALADRFDALIHGQQEAPNLFDIRPRLLKSTSGKINAAILDAFDRYLATFIYSVNVLLSDGRTAEVIYTHSAYRFPVVKTGNGELLNLNEHPDIRILQLKV